MTHLRRSLLTFALLLALTGSAWAQTQLNTTTMAAAMTATATSLSLTSATGVVAGGALYVGREYMTVGGSYVSGTTVPVVRAQKPVAHGISEPVYVGPVVAFINADRDGVCSPTAEAFLPQINPTSGKIWNCFVNVNKWIDEREVRTVECRALLAADQIDQSCFTADRPYLVYKITEVHLTAEVTAGTLTIMPTRQAGTQIPSTGATLATVGFNGKGVAQTVLTATVTATSANLLLGAGDRLALDFSATATELAGSTVTFYLYPY